LITMLGFKIDAFAMNADAIQYVDKIDAKTYTSDGLTFKYYDSYSLKDSLIMESTYNTTVTTDYLEMPEDSIAVPVNDNGSITVIFISKKQFTLNYHHYVNGVDKGVSTQKSYYDSYLQGYYTRFNQGSLSILKDMYINFDINWFNPSQSDYSKIGKSIQPILEDSMNDINNCEVDNEFVLKGFQPDADGNTISATWTGASKDLSLFEETNVYFQIGTGIRGESYITCSMESDTLFDIIPISDFNFNFALSYLEKQHIYSEHYVSCLRVIPTYKVNGKLVRGNYIDIFLNEDGFISSMDKDGYVDIVDLDDFYFYDVNISKPLETNLGIANFDISWSGTSYDSVIAERDENGLAIENFVDVTLIGLTVKNGVGDYKAFLLSDYTDSLILVRNQNTYNGNTFTINLEECVKICESEGYTFTGDVYLVPSYRKNDTIYRGLTKIVSLTHETVTDPNTPPSDGGGNGGGDIDLPPIPDVGDIGSVGNVFDYMISLFKSFMSGVGQVPSLLSSLVPFIPSQIIGLLCLGLLVAIILRLLGR